jgi:hypothetical protein
MMRVWLSAEQREVLNGNETPTTQAAPRTPEAPRMIRSSMRVPATPRHSTWWSRAEEAATRVRVLAQAVITGAPGLPNVGNTCYMNAGITVVAAVMARDPLLRHQLTKRPTKPGENPEMRAAFREVAEQLFQRGRTVVTRDAVRNLRDVSISSGFEAAYGRPADAGEWVHHLFDRAMEGYRPLRNKVKMACDAFDNPRNSPSEHKIPFIAVARVDDISASVLAFLRDHMVNSEPIPDYRPTDGRPETSPARKLEYFIDLPSSLFMTFGRSEPTGMKYRGEIEVNHRLYIPQYRIPRGGGAPHPASVVEYRRVAVAVHLPGHWVAYEERTNGEYLCHNDAQVSSCSRETFRDSVRRNGAFVGYVRRRVWALNELPERAAKELAIWEKMSKIHFR